MNGVDLHYSQTDNEGKKPFELCDSYEQTLQEAQSMIELKKTEKTRIIEQIQLEKEQMFLNEEDGDDDDDDDDEEDDDLEDDDDFTDSDNDAGDRDDDDEFFRDEL